MSKVFTPLNETLTERLKFNLSDVRVIKDINWHGRGRGLKAIVEIADKKYKVFGKSCNLPNCMCDAYIKEVRG